MSVHPDWQSTARLSLRQPTAADAPAVLRILSNRSVVEHNPSDLVVTLSEIEVLLAVNAWPANGADLQIYEEGLDEGQDKRSCPSMTIDGEGSTSSCHPRSSMPTAAR